MQASPVLIVRDSVTRDTLARMAEKQFGDMIKGVVDVSRCVMAIGGELHSDEEAALLEDGSIHQDLWGINLYPNDTGDALIEYDSMINVRPSQGNRSRGVEDEALRARIREVVHKLLSDA
jgi:hypothetical protein